MKRGTPYFAALRRYKKPELEPWTIGVHLRQKDENLFYSHLYIAVRKLRRAEDAIALLDDALRQASAQRKSDGLDLPECLSSYHNDALVQAGPYLVTLDGSCGQMHTLFAYEVADLIEMLRDAGLDVARRAVFNRCGDPELNIVSTESILTEARKKRKLYKHVLPGDREAAKRRARELPPVSPGAPGP